MRGSGFGGSSFGGSSFGGGSLGGSSFGGGSFGGTSFGSGMLGGRNSSILPALTVRGGSSFSGGRVGGSSLSSGMLGGRNCSTLPALTVTTIDRKGTSFGGSNFGGSGMLGGRNSSIFPESATRTHDRMLREMERTSDRMRQDMNLPDWWQNCTNSFRSKSVNPRRERRKSGSMLSVGARAAIDRMENFSNPLQQRLLQTDFIDFMQRGERVVARGAPRSSSVDHGEHRVLESQPPQPWIVIPNSSTENGPSALPTHRMTAAEASAALTLSDEQHLCVICMENFTEGDELRTLPCIHRFHCGCVDKWLFHNTSCPICKTRLDGAIEAMVLSQPCALSEASGAGHAGTDTEALEWRGKQRPRSSSKSSCCVIA